LCVELDLKVIIIGRGSRTIERELEPGNKFNKRESVTASTVSKSRQTGTVVQLIVVLGIIGGIFLLFNALGVFRPTLPIKHEVTYRVDGTASTAILTYTKEDGSSTPRFDATLPWSRKIVFSDRTLAILTAGNTTQTGNIRCTILLDGKEWKKEENKMPSDRVSCAGIVP
jgi:hypothetical protein